MSFGIWEATVPMFVNTLGDMRVWLDKAAAEKDEAALLTACLAPDMKPLPAQYQIASDELAVEIPKLRKLLETDIRALEKQLDAAGAPATPGRLPDWKK